MAIPKEARRLVFELIEQAAPLYMDPAGEIDKQGLREDVIGRLRAGHPDTFAAYCTGSCEHAMRLDVEEWVRKAMGPEPEQHRAMVAIGANARQMRRIIQVPQEDGTYKAKERLSLTLAEIDRVLEHRTGLLKAHAREIAWCKKTRRLWIQRGLPETATVRDLLVYAA